MLKNTHHSAVSRELSQEELKQLRKHHIAYVCGSTEPYSLEGFNEWIIDLFEDELADNTKYYAHGFSDIVGDDPPYQKTFWIEAPTEDFLPQEKLFLASLTWGMKRRYHLDYDVYSNTNRTADINEKLYYDENGATGTYYEVNMYEDGKLVERRPIIGHSKHYAEDCAENWICGVIK